MDSPILIIFVEFVEKCNVPLPGKHSTFAYIFGSWARENTTFYFAESFCCFRVNKSVLETAETKQADSQLHFAPKIIEIHLLVFENELIEDAMLVPKKS